MPEAADEEFLPEWVMRDAASVAGDFVRHWSAELATGTTILPGGGTRFTPGLLRALHEEVRTLDENALRWLLVAALVNAAAALREES